MILIALLSGRNGSAPRIRRTCDHPHLFSERVDRRWGIRRRPDHRVNRPEAPAHELARRRTAAANGRLTRRHRSRLAAAARHAERGMLFDGSQKIANRRLITAQDVSMRDGGKAWETGSH